MTPDPAPSATSTDPGPDDARGASRLARASGLIAAVTMASRLLGFGRWLVFAACVGAGTVGSAYGTANSVPNVLYEVAAGGALAASVVPLVSSALARGRRDEVDTIASSLLTWALVVLVPLAVAVWALAGPVAGALVPAGAEDRAATVAMTATMLRWFAPQVPLYGVGVVCAGVLQAHRRFAAPALAPLASSVVAVLTYVAYGVVRGAHGEGAGPLALLAGGTTLGVVALSLPLLVPLRRAGVRLRPALRMPPGAGARLRSLVGAGVVALLAQQLAVLVTIRVANSDDGAGVLTVYQYGQAVYLLPYAVLAVPVATAVFPDLAHAERRDTGGVTGAGDVAGPDGGAGERAAARLAGSLHVVAVACGVGAAALLGAAGPVGRFFGAVDAAGARSGGVDVAPAMTALLVTLAPGLVGYGLTALLTRALYVRGAPRTASAWVAVGWAVAAAVPALATAVAAPGAVTRLGLIGVASTAGMTLTAAGLVAAVRRHWPGAALAGLGRAVLAAVLAVVAGGLAGAGAGLVLPAGGGAAGAVACGVLQGLVAVAVAGAVTGVADRDAARALAARLGRRARRGA